MAEILREVILWREIIKFYQKFMKQLHPRAFWLFFIHALFQWLFIFLVLGVYGIMILFAAIGGDENIIGSRFFWWTLAVAISFIVLLVIWAKLSYRFYRYELTDDGFRKQMGVISKKYVTIPYGKIQNIDIYRGVLARLLGLSDLNIQTAGAPAQASSYIGLMSITGRAEGRLPGLSREDAEVLCKELINRARQLKNQEL